MHVHPSYLISFQLYEVLNLWTGTYEFDRRDGAGTSSETHPGSWQVPPGSYRTPEAFLLAVETKPELNR